MSYTTNLQIFHFAAAQQAWSAENTDSMLREMKSQGQTHS